MIFRYSNSFLDTILKKIFNFKLDYLKRKDLQEKVHFEKN